MNLQNSMLVTYKELDGNYQDYLIIVECGTIRASEVDDLPGTRYKTTSRISRERSNVIVGRLVSDIARLAGKTYEETCAFLDVD